MISFAPLMPTAARSFIHIKPFGDLICCFSTFHFANNQFSENASRTEADRVEARKQRAKPAASKNYSHGNRGRPQPFRCKILLEFRKCAIYVALRPTDYLIAIGVGCGSRCRWENLQEFFNMFY